VSRPVRIAAAAVLSAAALFAQGCGNACLSLAEQICVCLPDDGTRAACNQRAKNNQDIYSVRAQDEAYCQQQLDAHACDCNNLLTAAGKAACGLSYLAN
jgi:hypothetical protein